VSFSTVFHRSFLLSGSAAILAVAHAPAHAEDADAGTGRSPALDAILVTGSAASAVDVGGSATYLDLEELENFAYTDINRVLRQVPGINLREEEGFGLRPNIAIRGSYDDRNSKIAIYEDGVLKAPAPYAAPAAYYFPNIGRMAAVEVVKGAGAIKYGPHTAAGAVHFLSNAIPDTVDGISGKGQISAGERGTLRAHALAGGYKRLGDYDLGVSVETHQGRSNGFKQLDNGGPTGFSTEDYVGKIALRSNEGAALQQSLEFKFQYYKQHSDETYLGLSQADFAVTPNRRYAGSQRDEMDVEHYTYQLTHDVDFGDGWGLTTVGYITKSHRIWYKLQDVRNSDGANRSMAAVLADPADPANASAYAYLTGSDSGAGDLRVRNNDRLYRSKGVQTVLTKDVALGGSNHALELSARYHEDEEDRFQQDDRYTMLNGTMVLSSAGQPGSNANQVNAAEAWSFFLRDTIALGRLTVTPGIRYETIDLKRTRYASTSSSTDRDNRGTLIDSGSNNMDVWIPGISTTYDLGGNLLLLGGVHRGFTNPSPVSAGSTLAEPEVSTNWEAGLRYTGENAQISLIGFFNDYSNFVGTCTESSGGGCNIGDQFSGGRVHAKGVEFTAQYDAGAMLGDGFTMPLGVIYTYTHATFRDSLNSFGPWGENVVKGDLLPNLPQHLITVNAGIGKGGWRLDLTGNYTSETFGEAGAGAQSDPFLRIAPRMIFDLSGEIGLVENAALFGSVENLFDKTYNVGTQPAGWRPGLPRTILGGVRFAF
jgi:Fe(3+) dicitrate transport protein